MTCLVRIIRLFGFKIKTLYARDSQLSCNASPGMLVLKGLLKDCWHMGRDTTHSDGSKILRRAPFPSQLDLPYCVSHMKASGDPAPASHLCLPLSTARSCCHCWLPAFQACSISPSYTSSSKMPEVGPQCGTTATSGMPSP